LGRRNCQRTEAEGFVRGPQVTYVTHPNKVNAGKDVMLVFLVHAPLVRNRENLKIETSLLFMVPKGFEENVLAKQRFHPVSLQSTLKVVLIWFLY